MGGVQAKPAPTLSILTGAPAPAPAPSGGWVKTAITVVGILVLAIIAYIVYEHIRYANGLPPLDVFGVMSDSKDISPEPLDGKEKLMIGADQAPLTTGSDYGMQFWMYIEDWSYRFGQKKDVVKRVAVGSPQTVNPRIALHPTDNSLDVTVTIFPSETTEEGAQAAATTGNVGTNGTDFTCSVENVPLQAWFSVSVTVFQRNLDIYINGRLVKSCILPGIPKLAAGDITIGDAGGFSGSFCNLHNYPKMLTPEDAKTFFAAGTTCGPTPPPGEDDSWVLNLFGYTFRFSLFNKEGKEVRNYTF